MNKAKPSLNNISDFIEGHARAFAPHLNAHVTEQAEVRAILCTPCTENGSCLSCGCKTPQLYYATNRSCSKAKWGPMMDKTEWEKHKEENPLYRTEALTQYLDTPHPYKKLPTDGSDSNTFPDKE